MLKPLKDRTAADYIGGVLKASLPVNVFTAINSGFDYEAKPGQIIGTIYSYIVRDGKLFWQLDTSKGVRFVEMKPNAFDPDFLEQSLIAFDRAKQTGLDKRIEERISKNDSPLYAGNVIKSIKGFSHILIIMIILVIALVLYRSLS